MTVFITIWQCMHLVLDWMILIYQHPLQGYCPIVRLCERNNNILNQLLFIYVSNFQDNTNGGGSQSHNEFVKTKLKSIQPLKLKFCFTQGLNFYINKTYAILDK